MNYVKVGNHVINLDSVTWVETVEARPTAHFTGGGEFRPRTDEEAKDLHRVITAHLAAGDAVPAFAPWKRS